MGVEAERAQLLLLATFHMGNPGRDLVNMHVDDVLAAHRQAELEDIAARLARFAPTTVCVEYPVSHQDDVDNAYRKYLEGTAETIASEIQQVGFRLAARCGLERVFAVDDDTPMRWEGLQAYIARDPARERWFEESTREAQARADADSERLLGSTLREFLAGFNTEEFLRANLAYYIDMLGLGDDGEDVGADLAASWYERNLRIFGNIARITEPAGRVFVVFGAGHVPILRHLGETSGRYALEDATTYLA